MEVDIKADFDDLNQKIIEVEKELNQIRVNGRALEQHLLRLQGAALYLKDKNTPQEEKQEVEQKEGSTEDFERSEEYPSNDES